MEFQLFGAVQINSVIRIPLTSERTRV